MPCSPGFCVSSLTGGGGARDLESDPRLPARPHELRCPAAILPPHRPRHHPAHQDEPQYPDTEWCVDPPGTILAAVGNPAPSRLPLRTDRPMHRSHCVRTLVGLHHFTLRRPSHRDRLHQRHPVLLPLPRRDGQAGPVPPEQPSRCVSGAPERSPASLLTTPHRHRESHRRGPDRDRLRAPITAAVRGLLPHAQVPRPPHTSRGR